MTRSAAERADRILIAQIAADTRWAHCSDRTAALAPARQGLQNKWEREVDPDGVLEPQERAKRADNLMRAHMRRMARASAKARRRKAQRGGDAA